MMTDSKLTSIEIGRAALKIAVTGSRPEEQRVKQELAEQGIRSTAVDFGGEFIPSIVKIVERAVVAAQRQGLVSDTHVGAGAVAGAAMRRWNRSKPRPWGLMWAARSVSPAAASICASLFIWR